MAHTTHQLKQIKLPATFHFTSIHPPHFQGFVYVSNFSQSQMNFKSMHVDVYVRFLIKT